MGKKKTNKHGMPSLTVDGKRQIIKAVLSHVGEKELLLWLKDYNIGSIRELNEHVRNYKSRFFKELYALLD